MRILIKIVNKKHYLVKYKDGFIITILIVKSTFLVGFYFNIGMINRIESSKTSFKKSLILLSYLFEYIHQFKTKISFLATILKNKQALCISSKIITSFLTLFS